MLCGIHNVEMSQRQGQYGMFWSCPTKNPDGSWCRWKPQRPQSSGWSGVRQQVAQKVAPEKAVMTKEDWEAKEARTNKNILLQVAFKAAVKLICHGKTQPGQTVFAITQEFHDWLLTHTEGQTKPISQNTAPQQTLGTMVGFQEGYTPPQEGEDIPLPQEPW